MIPAQALYKIRTLLIAQWTLQAARGKRPSFFYPHLSLDSACQFPPLCAPMARKNTPKPENGSDLDHYATERPSDPAAQIISVDEKGLREMLLKLRSSEGYIADLAAKLGVSAQYLGEVLNGDKGFGPKLLRGLGVVRTYRMFDVEVIMEDSGDERIA